MSAMIGNRVAFALAVGFLYTALASRTLQQSANDDSSEVRVCFLEASDTACVLNFAGIAENSCVQGSQDSPGTGLQPYAHGSNCALPVRISCQQLVPILEDGTSPALDNLERCTDRSFISAVEDDLTTVQRLAGAFRSA